MPGGTAWHTGGIRRYRALVKLGLLAVLAAGGLFWMHLIGLSPFAELQALYVRGREAASHPWFPPAFVLLYVLAALAGFPTFLLSIVAGALYGVFSGTLLVLAGANVGAWAGYGVGGGLGGEMRRRLSERYGALDAFQRGLAAGAFGWVLQVRLLPILPFSVSNFALGALACPFSKYAWATALGLVPLTLVYTFFGGSLRDLLERGAPIEEGAAFTLQVTLFRVALALAAWAVWRIARRAESAKD